MSKVVKKSNIQDNYRNIVLNIKIVEIEEPRIAMRNNIDVQEIQSLMSSIKEVGLICPICVMKSGEKFEIVAGNRRFVACRKLGWTEISCIVIEQNSEMYFKTMTAENYERQDVSIIDEVNFIDRLNTELNLSQNQIAKYISKSASYVSERLAVLNYPAVLLEALMNNKITFSVAREFNKITEPQACETYLHYAVENGCTPEIARKWRKQWELQKEKPDITTLEEISEKYAESQQVTQIKMKCAGCREEFETTELQVVYMCRTCRNATLSY